jgi:hypothetical protein
MKLNKRIMKHHISWTGYLEGVILLLVIYYGYVFIKFYLPLLSAKVTGAADGANAEAVLPFELLSATATAPVAAAVDEDMFEQQLYYRESEQTMEDADLFIGRAKQALDIAAKRPYSAERTIKELKEIASAFPSLKRSPYLPGIAEVIARRCEETGTATLTAAQVSEWWDEQ